MRSRRSSPTRELNIEGFHFYTFNQLVDTWRWEREKAPQRRFRTQAAPDVSEVRRGHRIQSKAARMAGEESR